MFPCLIRKRALGQATSGCCRAVAAKRSLSTTNNNDDEDNRDSLVPKPTWSIQSLELSSSIAKLPEGELDRLAHRALLDTSKLPSDLEQDLANMMHMVQQVSEYVQENPQMFPEDDAQVYDFVRGVTAAPLRKESDDQEDREEAQQVWKSYLQPRTIRQGGSHQYFSIRTHKEET